MQELDQTQQFIITMSKIKARTIATLLEEFANSEGEGLLPSNKRQAWNLAQTLRFEAQN
jgi:hypothetical protein